MITRNDPCWCGSGKKWKKCHYPTPPKSDIKQAYLKKYGIILKTEEEIQKISKACQTASSILKILCEEAKPGITTNHLDKLSQKLHMEKKAIPACLGYGEPPFPKTICTSINDVICHGIPDDRPLQEGDIINIDVTSIVDGCYGDCSKMVVVGGKTDSEKQKVVDTSYECLMASIAICKPGVMLFEIGDVIEAIAAKQGCSVVDQFVGHGVGLSFHEPPQVCHHTNHMQIPLAPGMTFTIEPMINAGVKDAVIMSDGWTAKTADNKPSAQWEHTIVITETGHEILT
jgi:methionyl aminopeptidase